MKIYKDFPLAEILYYKIGGRAKFVLKIQNKEDLKKALDFVYKNNPPVFDPEGLRPEWAGGKKILPIGLGSNLLVNDKPFDGAVLWFCKAESSSIVVRENNSIEAFASVILDDLIQFSFKNNLIGLEWAGGLPSTVGGAVRGNVGAFGEEIKNIVNIVEIVKLLDEKYILEKLTRDQLGFAYRDSLIKRNKNLLIISASFQLQKSSDEKVERARKIYQDHIEYRKKNHPMEYPSCGSVFQNIVEKEDVDSVLQKWPDIKELSANKWHGKIAMGYVINRLGFAGLQVGGAQVSKKHANYIVNVQSAKFTDVISIIDKIKEKFLSTFGFSPDLELEIVE